MKITIDNREVEIQGNSISFLNEQLGLVQKVIPRSLTYDFVTKSVSINAAARTLSPTGVEVTETNLGALNIEFDSQEFTSPEFQAKYLNGMFRSVMNRFGLSVHQVISEESGEVEVIVETPPQTPAHPAWVQPTGAHDSYPKDAKVRHNDKNWESTVDANVREPGVSGWREI